jgi:hypothetical protein
MSSGVENFVVYVGFGIHYDGRSRVIMFWVLSSVMLVVAATETCLSWTDCLSIA